MLRFIHRHIGVRAEGMILAAAFWGLVGLSLLTRPSTPVPAPLYAFLPLWLQVGLWWGPAAIAIAVSTHERWSLWGIGLMQAGPIAFGASSLGAWILALIPGPPPGDPRGWVSATFYALMVPYVLHLSHIDPDAHWTPPSRRHLRRRPDRVTA